jgi:hypothetical protein
MKGAVAQLTKVADEVRHHVLETSRSNDCGFATNQRISRTSNSPTSIKLMRLFSRCA